MTIPLDSLPPEARQRVLAQSGRQRAPRQQTFTKNKARTLAFRVLSVVADLTPQERERVLKLALQMNAI